MRIEATLKQSINLFPSALLTPPVKIALPAVCRHQALTPEMSCIADRDLPLFGDDC